MVPKDLSATQARRFQLWRALVDLSNAQADGQLTAEQARLLESLADNLQQLAGQLHQLAALGQELSGLLEGDRPTGSPSQLPHQATPPES